MRILSWNILQGGGSRVEGILKTLEGHGADVIALQEFRHGKSMLRLMGGLEDLGLTYSFTPDPGSKSANTVALFSFYPLEDKAVVDPNEGSVAQAISAKISLIDSDAPDINLVTLHLPQKQAQLPYFKTLNELSIEYRDGSTLLIGDFNCGIPFEDSETKTFYATQQFQNLLSQGWVDTWRSRHGSEKEFTWISSRTGNGFRYDHALASDELNQSITNVTYDHTPREAGYSDHSLMIVDIDTHT